MRVTLCEYTNRIKDLLLCSCSLNRKCPVNVVLDAGPTVSFIDEDIVDFLNIKKNDTTKRRVQGLNGIIAITSLRSCIYFRLSQKMITPAWLKKFTRRRNHDEETVRCKIVISRAMESHLLSLIVFHIWN